MARERVSEGSSGRKETLSICVERTRETMRDINKTAKLKKKE